MYNYRREGKVAERPHLNLPDGSYEEELGLDGFYGPVSHLYHHNPPTSWSNLQKASFQWPKKDSVEADFLKPQCFKKEESSSEGDFFSSCKTLFWNSDIAVHFHKPQGFSKTYFRNADASEVFFCHEGRTSLQSSFGDLEVKKGDYVIVPKGVTYRFQGGAPYLLRIENFESSFKKPDTGLMGQQALYHEEGLRYPQFSASKNEEQKTTILIQKDLKLTELTYDFDIRNLAGWCGTLYPFSLNVSQIAPAMSPVAHLPPSINSTFVSDSFIVCTFLPRPLEEPEGALKVPFYHSNIDYDEVIFYHDGDFFSRDNMGAGYVSLHPRGINHGPHPKALKNQHSKTRTNEIAVMIDTFKPLHVTSLARSLELGDYWKSWRPE